MGMRGAVSATPWRTAARVVFAVLLLPTMVSSAGTVFHLATRSTREGRGLAFLLTAAGSWILLCCGSIHLLQYLAPATAVFEDEFGFAPPAGVQDLSGGVLWTYDGTDVRLRFRAAPTTVDRIIRDDRWSQHPGTSFRYLTESFCAEELDDVTRVLVTDQWCEPMMTQAVLCVNDDTGEVAFRALCGGS